MYVFFVVILNLVKDTKFNFLPKSESNKLMLLKVLVKNTIDFFVLEILIFLQVLHLTYKIITFHQGFMMQYIMVFQNTEGHICLKTQKEKLCKKELTEFGLTDKVL